MGTHFCGWQKQNYGRSVEGTLLEALEKLPFKIEHFQASGRTDAGVHAKGQVVAFNFDQPNIPIKKFPHIINPILPYDLQVVASEEVAHTFNPRRDASARLYCYKICTSQAIIPMHPDVTFIRHDLHLANLNRLASLFVGQHDFTAFCSTKDMNKSKIRTIYSANFIVQDNIIHFYIKGNAFLMNMVRQIVGTLIEPITFEKNYYRIKEALQSGLKNLTGATALPNGLTLEYVEYKKIKPHDAGGEFDPT